MHFTYLLLSFSLALLVLVMETAAASPDLNSLHQLMTRLDEGGAPERFPMEFASFKESMDVAAELVAGTSESDAAEKIEFATMKGAVLEKKLVDRSLHEPGNLPATGLFPEPRNSPPLTHLKSIPSAGLFANITSLPRNPSPFQLPPAESSSRPPAASPGVQTVIPCSDALWGGKKTYVVKKGDTIRVVAAKLGVSWRRLARENGLEIRTPLLKAGMRLKYNDRKIVPKNIVDGILVNIPDRTLYLFKEGKVRRTASVTVGMPRVAVKDEDEDVAPEELVKWQTPTGIFTVTGKSKDPIWSVPPSIQKEMRQQGKEVRVKVPPGKDNPLGRYALKTSLKGIMLHSTNVPASIYGFNSHGCIRVSPVAMEDIFRSVAVNTKGEIVYMPVKVAVTENGRVFLEVHKDVYAKRKDLHQEVQMLVMKYKIADLIDWKRVDQLLKQQSGIAEDITRKL